MKFPKKLQHRGRVLATIYAKKPDRPDYRLYWRVDRKTRPQEFRTYAEAKRAGDTIVRDLAKGSQITALTPAQASDALAAQEILQNFYQSTGTGSKNSEGGWVCRHTANADRSTRSAEHSTLKPAQSAHGLM